MNKKGLSKLIIVLIILIIIVSSLILIILFKTKSQKEKQITIEQSKVDLEIVNGSVLITDNGISLKVHRSAGNGKLTKIKFTLLDEKGKSISIKLPAFDLKEFETKTFSVKRKITSKAISISIQAIIKEENKKEAITPIMNKYFIKGDEPIIEECISNNLCAYDICSNETCINDCGEIVEGKKIDGDCGKNIDCISNNSCQLDTCLRETCQDDCNNIYDGIKTDGDCGNVTCIPDYSCQLNICSNETCSDECNGIVNGTKTDGDCGNVTCIPDYSCQLNTCFGETCLDNCNNIYNGKRDCSKDICGNNQIYVGGNCIEGILIDVNTSKTLTGFNNKIVGGANIGGQTINKTYLNKFVTEIGSDFYRIKFPTWQMNQALNNYLVFQGIDYTTQTKEYVDLVHQNNGEVIFQFYGMPNWSSDCYNQKSKAYCDNTESNNVPNYGKYPPTNYADWNNLVSGLITKLNELNINIDYFEIYGEPNFGSTWWDTSITNGILSFNKHYNETINSIHNINPNAKVGGAAFGGTSLPFGQSKGTDYTKGYEWINQFLDYIKQNKIDMDFFSWHYYGTRTDIFGINSNLIRGYLNQRGFTNIPIFLTEWGIDGGKNLDVKAATLLGASFVTSSLIKISQGKDDKQNFYKLTDNSNINRGDTTKGNFGLIGNCPNNCIVKSSFNAFKLFSMLKGDKIETTTNENSYNLTIKGITLNQKDIQVLGTKTKNNISIIITNYIPIDKTDLPDYAPSKEIEIIIKEIPFSEYKYKIYLIDREHSNYLSTSGNPELEIIDQGQNLSGDFQKQLNLPNYGVVLIKIDKI